MICPSLAFPTITLAVELPEEIEFCCSLVISRATARVEAIFFALGNELWLRDSRVGDGEGVKINDKYGALAGFSH
jgi:hypothetical protein